MEEKEIDKKEQKIRGKKPQEKIERFLLKPCYSPIFGVTVTKDTDIDDIECDGEIHQTIKDLTLTTEIHKQIKNEEYEFEEESKVTIKLKEGTRLIWQEGQGYILPSVPVTTRKDIREELEALNGIEGLN